MATDQAAMTDAEIRRREAVSELIEERGANWREEFAPGTLGCHELLDRAALIAGLVDQQILDHPACLQNEQWYKLAESAAEALNNLYQAVGAAHLDAETAESE
jgi:hypothetical protein